MITSDAAPVRGHAEDGHFPQLDGLRGLAVLAVVIHHNSRLYFADLGGLGVNLFFVLSGFLITGILLRARERASAQGQTLKSVMGAFYARRLLRIFPLYYAVLVFGILAGLPNMDGEGTGYHFAYLSNVYLFKRGSFQGQPVNHLWTLAVEEQFYLVLPALVLFAPKRLLKWSVSALVLLSPVCRLVLGGLTGSWLQSTILLPSCFDNLGAGSLLAIFCSEAPGREPLRARSVAIFGWIGFALFAIVLVCRFFQTGWRLQLAAYNFSVAPIFVWCVYSASRGYRGIAKTVLESGPLVYMGKISYGIYLLHEFVPPVVTMLGAAVPGSPSLPQAGIFRTVLVLTLTVLTAALSWHCFEAPLNRLKRFFPYHPRVRRDGCPNRVGSILLPTEAVAAAQ
jgi:peptidoglycan/LPS O-acetylase OafA/YrhL